MKAVVVKKPRSISGLSFCDVEKPEPAENEVLVKIIAVSVNAADYRSMRIGIIPIKKIFGADIAGSVEGVGKGAKVLKVGDEVFGDISSCGFGGFAEYVAVPETMLALKPANVTFEQAAAVPIAAVTALQALRDRGCIQAGQSVMIYGAGGGVGSYAVQLARYFGAVVTAVCSPYNIDPIRMLGADKVINYVNDVVFKAGERYDLIVAVNGDRPLSEYKRALKPDGIFVCAGGALSQVLKTIAFGKLMSVGGKKIRFLAAKPDVKDLEFIIKLVIEGKIKPVIDRRYPLHETAQAMKYLNEGHARGKVIINVA